MNIEKTDIVKIISTIRANYDNAYSKLTDDEKTLLLNSWYEILKDYPKELVYAAVKRVIMHSEYTPRVSHVVNEVESMTAAVQSESENGLWLALTSVLSEVSGCVYRYQYTDFIERNGKSQGQNARDRVREIFGTLPQVVQEYLHDVRMLEHLADLSDEQLEFERSRFLKIIPETRKKLSIKRELGTSVHNLLTTNKEY